MRNGMSVKDIYDALDQRDRLQNAYCRELERHLTLRQAVREIYDRIERTAKNYRALSRDRTNNYEDQCEYYNRNAGLLEALTIIEMTLNKNNVEGVLPRKEDSE